MAPRFKSVAVIGTGPSGISSVKALHDEKCFQTIRVFERRDRAGGMWHYDPTPDIFSYGSGPVANEIPDNLPCLAPPLPEDFTARTAIYSALDSNVGATAMSFTHRPFPDVNSDLSIKRFGYPNPTRPFRVIETYLEDIYAEYTHLTSFNTNVERVEKVNGKWVLTLRQSGHFFANQPQDYWWQEQFEAVIIASGHHSVPFVPDIPGIEPAVENFPTTFEHSKSFRNIQDYSGKKVLVVGGSVSSSDLVVDLYATASSMEVSLRGRDEIRESAWKLPNVSLRPTIKQFHTSETSIIVEFTDGTQTRPDKIIFATGYWLSYPFLTPNPVTPQNRVAGFYQHIFNIDDPSMALVGQIRGGITFRIYEYQAVAVARWFAAKNGIELPSQRDQYAWEADRLKSKGETPLFHEIKPDFSEYFGFLCDLAGPCILPKYEDELAERAFEVLKLKDKYYKSLQAPLSAA